MKLSRQFFIIIIYSIGVWFKLCGNEFNRFEILLNKYFRVDNVRSNVIKAKLLLD